MDTISSPVCEARVAELASILYGAVTTDEYGTTGASDVSAGGRRGWHKPPIRYV